MSNAQKDLGYYNAMADDTGAVKVIADSVLRTLQRRVGQWRAEECQNGLAHQPGNRPLIGVDRPDHVLESAVYYFRPLFRVQPLGRRGGQSLVPVGDR